MRLHYKTYGQQGDIVVILHGLFGSLENWHSVSVELSRDFRVFSVDQRNHGRSPHSQEMDYAWMARDLHQLFRDAGIARARVMGHSMGGKTTMTFALLFPQLLDKLVVVDIAPRRYPPVHADILEALLALDLAQVSTRKEMEEALGRSIPSLALRQFLLKNVERTPAGRFRWRMGLEEIHRSYRHLAAAVPDGGHCEKPALFVRGESSDYLGEGDLVEIRRLFPSAKMETIPRAGHLVHVENPAAFLPLVRDFLS